jgi:hypothetical protein
MCQGCKDFLDFERAVDTYLAEKLPEMLARPLDHAVIYGNEVGR